MFFECTCIYKAAKFKDVAHCLTGAEEERRSPAVVGKVKICG